MSGNSPAVPSYEERYVAFIDILGFRNVIARTTKEPRVVEDVRAAMNGISARAIKSRSAGMQATSFSDNIVLSVPVSSDALTTLFETIDAFSTDLLTKNMLFRGAVVRGQLIHDENVVFGPALVHAYQLETNTAFHPRIMLHEIVYNDCEQYAHDGSSACRTFVAIDAYDVAYISPFAGIADAPEPEAVASLVRLLGIITAGLAGSAGQPAISEKYKWLARRFDAFVVARGLDGKTGLVKPDEL